MSNGIKISRNWPETADRQGIRHDVNTTRGSRDGKPRRLKLAVGSAFPAVFTGGLRVAVVCRDYHRGTSASVDGGSDTWSDTDVQVVRQAGETATLAKARASIPTSTETGEM